MQQAWNLKSRAHECARLARPFEEGEVFYTSIYFDTQTGEFVRRDVSLDGWEEEMAERTPFSYWKSEYVKPEAMKPKVEITGRESPESLLQRLIEEDDSRSENARYILALMLERKRQIAPKEVKESEHGKMIVYENKKTGEVYIIRDPELKLDEMESVQDEVAMLLGFGGPAAEAAAAVGMKITTDGKVESVEKPSAAPPRKKQAPEPSLVAPDDPEQPQTEEDTDEKAGDAGD